MKKLSLILVALVTMVMVGCKPLTGCTHIYDDGVVTEPTCATNGVKTYTCTLCGDKQYEPIPATGNHTWVDTDCADNEKVPSAKYYLKNGVLTFELVYVSPKYKCSVCGEGEGIDKTKSFFTTDDHKTTIGVATDVYRNDWEEPELRLDTTWTVEKYNSYYENRNSYSSVCNCGGECVGNCGGSTCDCNKLTCIRLVPTDRNTNILYFGSYYIEY